MTTMKTLLALTLAAAALSPAFAADDDALSRAQSEQMEFLAQNRQNQAAWNERVACFLHRNCLKLKKDLIVESSNKDYFISRILVSSEFERGSKVLEREKQERLTPARYIGYAVAAENLPSGRPGFAAGKYANKNPGYLYPKLLPWGEYGKPGIVAFEFLAVGPNEAFIGDNGTAELTHYDYPCREQSPVADVKRAWAGLRGQSDPCEPQARGTEKVRLAPTAYDSGVRRAMVVEVPYDQLQRLLNGKTPSLTGEIQYYVRGGFQREVYDRYPFNDYNTFRDIDGYSADFAKHRAAELAADDPAAKAESAKIAAVQEMITAISRGLKSRTAVLRLTESEGREQTLSLEFQ